MKSVRLPAKLLPLDSRTKLNNEVTIPEHLHVAEDAKFVDALAPVHVSDVNASMLKVRDTLLWCILAALL